MLWTIDLALSTHLIEPYRSWKNYVRYISYVIPKVKIEITSPDGIMPCNQPKAKNVMVSILFGPLKNTGVISHYKRSRSGLIDFHQCHIGRGPIGLAFEVDFQNISFGELIIFRIIFVFHLLVDKGTVFPPE